MRSVVAGAAAAALLWASAASAQGPGGGTAPLYPGNTLRLEQTMPIVSGAVVKVGMSGHAEWGEPTDVATISYTLAIYAQNADVHPSCEVSYGAQLGKSINIPTLGASEAITDWVLADDLRINPNPPNSGIDWSAESLPFVITPGVRNLLLCAFQRYVTDDVAWYQLPVRVQDPSCTVQPRSGRKLRLQCNVSGKMTLRFKRSGAKSRTISATIDSSGTKTFSARKLRKARYRVTVTTGAIELGRQRIRIR